MKILRLLAFIACASTFLFPTAAVSRADPPGSSTSAAPAVWLLRVKPGRDSGLLCPDRREHLTIVRERVREAGVEVLVNHDSGSPRTPGAIVIAGEPARIAALRQSVKRNLSDDEQVETLGLEISVRLWSNEPGAGQRPRSFVVYSFNQRPGALKADGKTMLAVMRLLRDEGPRVVTDRYFQHPAWAVAADRITWSAFLPLEDTAFATGYERSHPAD